jgi:quercetin dioxygenase-like cupin family protein
MSNNSSHVKGAEMSDFTIVNFNEIEDSAADREGMEARFAREHLDSDHLGVSCIRYDANVRSPRAHSHREQEEVYVVLSGSGLIRLDDAVHELRQWDVVRVNPTTVRAFEAGDDGLELIAIGSDRPDGGDGVFVEPAWFE